MLKTIDHVRHLLHDEIFYNLRIPKRLQHDPNHAGPVSTRIALPMGYWVLAGF